MKSKVFLVTLFLATAAAAHLAYALLAPGLQMDRLMRMARASAGQNAIGLLSPAQREAMLGTAGARSAVAVCPYDLTDGSLTLDARYPDEPWTFAVYSSRGEPLAALDDREAGADAITVRIVEARGILDVLTADPPPRRASGELLIEVAHSSGLIVLSALIDEPAKQASAEAVLASSRCRIDAS